MPSRGIIGSYGCFYPSFFKWISISFSIVAVSIHMLINRTRGSPFFHTHSNICCLWMCLIMAILCGVRWYLNIVLNCISLIRSNWCFWTVVLEKTLESPLNCKEIQPVHPEGSQSWLFFGRTDAEAETPILWPPDAENWLIGKDPDAGKDWGQGEEGTTQGKMVGWHHQLSGHDLE